MAANVDLKRKDGECNSPEKLLMIVQVQQQEVDGADAEDLQVSKND